MAPALSWPLPIGKSSDLQTARSIGSLRIYRRAWQEFQMVRVWFRTKTTGPHCGEDGRKVLRLGFATDAVGYFSFPCQVFQSARIASAIFVLAI